MSIIDRLINAKTNFENQTTAFATAQADLTTAEKGLRFIDPQFLGEKRYDESARWWITRKVYDFCYSIKNLWHRNQIKQLSADKQKAVSEISTTAAALAQALSTYNGLNSELTEKIDQLNSKKKEQEAALAVLGAPIYDSNAHWFFTNGALHLCNSVYQRWNKSNTDSQRAAIESELAQTKAELQPLADYQATSETTAPVETQPTLAFENLKIDGSQKKLMMETIPVVANGTILDLIPKIPTFLEAKKTLGPLHPLKSLEEILTNPTLRKSLATISQVPTKWKGKWIFGYGQVDGFLQSTVKRLEKYHAKGEIIPCLSGFAQAIGLTTPDQKQKLTDFANVQNWEGFVTEMAAIARTTM